MAGRRGNHEGSIYQRASDGRWLGAALLGYDERGRPIRKTVSATTRSEVVRKLKQLRREIDDGQIVAGASVKLSASRLSHDDRSEYPPVRFSRVEQGSDPVVLETCESQSRCV